MKWSKAARSMVPVIIVSSLIIAGIGAIVFRSFDAIPFSAGVFFLALFNIFKVFLLDRAVWKVARMAETDVNHGKNYIQLQALMRFGLTALALLASAVVFGLIYGGSGAGLGLSELGEKGVWGACAGAVTYHIAMYALRFMKLGEDDKEGDSL